MAARRPLLPRLPALRSLWRHSWLSRQAPPCPRRAPPPSSSRRLHRRERRPSHRSGTASAKSADLPRKSAAPPRPCYPSTRPRRRRRRSASYAWLSAGPSCCGRRSRHRPHAHNTALSTDLPARRLRSRRRSHRHASEARASVDSASPPCGTRTCRARARNGASEKRSIAAPVTRTEAAAGAARPPPTKRQSRRSRRSITHGSRRRIAAERIARRPDRRTKRLDQLVSLPEIVSPSLTLPSSAPSSPAIAAPRPPLGAYAARRRRADTTRSVATVTTRIVAVTAIRRIAEMTVPAARAAVDRRRRTAIVPATAPRAPSRAHVIAVLGTVTPTRNATAAAATNTAATASAAHAKRSHADDAPREERPRPHAVTASRRPANWTFVST